MAWTTHASFQSLVHGIWDNRVNLQANNKVMTKALAKWSINTFGYIFHRKKRLLARLSEIQGNLAHHARSDLIELDRKLQKELDETLYQEELLWF